MSKDYGMRLYFTYLLAGLVNALLLLFLAGTYARTTLIPALAVIGALILFVTAGVTLFHEKAGAWLAIISLCPIWFWAAVIFWEERYSPGRVVPMLLVPLLCTVLASAGSINALLSGRQMPESGDNSVGPFMRWFLAFTPAVLLAAYLTLLISTAR